MLIGNRNSVADRVVTILFAMFGVTIGGVGLAAVGALSGFWAWPPKPSSAFGVACGILGAVLIFFEMAILPRKWMRGRRLGATVLWMRLHIWAGIVSLPVILIHGGLGFGNPLTTVTMALFLAVIASGLWGHVLQQWIPRRILSEVPNETIAARVQDVGLHYAREATLIVRELTDADAEEDDHEGHHGSARATTALISGATANDLTRFNERLLVPFLRDGRRSRSPLASRLEAERQFGEFRELAPDLAHLQIRRLEHLCELRRQSDLLLRLNGLLHHWLVVHLPLSVCMTSLMVLHAVRALKYW